MSNNVLFLLLIIFFFFTLNYGKIQEKHVGDYIIVFDEYNPRDWYSAEDYCQINFGTNLASIHSQDDFDTITNGLFVAHEDYCTWIGLNDINNETGFDGTINAPWEYTDGTNYDWELPWDPCCPRTSDDCVYLLFMKDHVVSGPGRYEFISSSCNGTLHPQRDIYHCHTQWACNGTCY